MTSTEQGTTEEQPAQTAAEKSANLRQRKLETAAKGVEAATKKIKRVQRERAAVAASAKSIGAKYDAAVATLNAAISTYALMHLLATDNQPDPATDPVLKVAQDSLTMEHENISTEDEQETGDGAEQEQADPADPFAQD